MPLNSVPMDRIDDAGADRLSVSRVARMSCFWKVYGSVNCAGSVNFFGNFCRAG